MKKHLLYLIISLLVLSCSQSPSPGNEIGYVKFTALLRPAFNESAEIVLSNRDSANEIAVYLKEISRDEKMPDTFYYATQRISNKLFRKFDSTVIQKTFIVQPKQWEGCCDGMPVYFSTIDGADTSGLYFRSPDRKSDTIGYRITKSMIDFLKTEFKDSIVSEYLDDIESYMDESKFHRADPLRKIDQLRMKRYNWTIRKTDPN